MTTIDTNVYRNIVCKRKKNDQERKHIISGEEMHGKVSDCSSQDELLINFEIILKKKRNR